MLHDFIETTLCKVSLRRHINIRTTKNILGKHDLREAKSMCNLVNKTNYIRWRIGNSIMQSLTLNHLLAVYTYSKPTVFRRIWRRCFLQTFSSMQIWKTADSTLRWGSLTKLPYVWVFGKRRPLYWQLTQELFMEYSHFEKDDHCIGNIARLTTKMELFLTYRHHTEAHLGLPQTS